jgi:hypothetical protein
MSLHVNDFRPELGQLRANIGLRNKDAGADCADAFEWTECWNNGRRCRSFQAHKPIWQLLPKFFDLIFVFENPLVVRHFSPLSASAKQCQRSDVAYESL